MFANHGSSLPVSCFFEKKKPTTYPALKSTPDIQQAALLTAHEKPTRETL